MILLPASGPAAPSKIASIAATISSGSAMRPSPASPLSAISPRVRADEGTPSSASVARLRRVAGCVHIFGFIAGAISTYLSVASSTVEARSLARPSASLAIRSAVAGATTIKSASRDRRIWPTSCSSLRSNRSVNTWSAVECSDRQRRDEFLRRRRHHAAHRSAALAQAADQVERLLGGDAAADDQQDALAGRVIARASQGLMISMPQCSKSLTLRVTTGNPHTRAIARYLGVNSLHGPSNALTMCRPMRAYGKRLGVDRMKEPGPARCFNERAGEIASALRFLPGSNVRCRTRFRPRDRRQEECITPHSGKPVHDCLVRLWL